MTHSFDGYNHLIRLDMGEKLSAALEQFIAESKIEGGWISGVGAANEIMLGFYQLSLKDYKMRTFGSMMEIVSLNGNFAYDEQGKVMWHLHGAFADSDYQTVGGHVKDFTAGATVELFVHRLQKPAHRKHHDATGLQILNFE
ncbi:MAG TPA: PPC domain-containing DNA-binding protein [Candidatus Saccharimonadales bacterium]|nr:PPC domain-containing DNA-binding protein [Candidatus Saccharimonadales bacterium]